MPIVPSNGIEIAYEEEGRGRPILMVMGIGAQLVLWPDAFCTGLAARGFRTIRFDNRDIGLSTKLTAAGMPNAPRAIGNALLGRKVDAPYTLMDMADDMAGLLDALNLEAAHVVGCSLGGMIAQSFAIAHPDRVLSLTSIMSSPGGRFNLLAKPGAIRALLSRAPRNVDEAVAWNLRFFRAVRGSKYPLDEAQIREMASRAYLRSNDTTGFPRQLAAILATGDRRGALKFVRVPTVVLHGAQDPMMLPHAGRATAAAIPGARLRTFEGMGHEMPRDLWPAFFDEIVAIADEGDARKRQFNRETLPGYAAPPC